MDSAHTAVTAGTCLGAEIIVNVTGSHHWMRLRLPTTRCQSSFNSALAVSKDFRVLSAHSKCHFRGLFVFLNKPISTHVHGHFEYFLYGGAFKSRLLLIGRGRGGTAL